MNEREPWIAVKVGVPDSGKIIDLPSDAARWGLIVLWAKAKRQTPSGVFRSERVARTLLGRYGKHVTTYVTQGFLHIAPVICPDARCQSSYQGLDAGAVAVHSWHDHQRDHALRQLAYRTGDALSDAVSDVIGDKSPVRALSVVSSQESEPTEGGPGETHPPDAVSAYYSLTGRFPRDNVLAWLKDLGQRHGEERASSMLAACYSESRDLGNLLGRTQARLRAEDHAADQRERVDEVARNRRKREPVGWEKELREAIAAQNGEGVPA